MVALYYNAICQNKWIWSVELNVKKCFHKWEFERGYWDGSVPTILGSDAVYIAYWIIDYIDARCVMGMLLVGAVLVMVGFFRRMGGVNTEGNVLQ